MIVYKIDVLAALREHGYTTYTIKQQKMISESSMQRIREGQCVAGQTLNSLCRLLHCQPGDLLEYIPDQKDEDGAPPM